MADFIVEKNSSRCTRLGNISKIAVCCLIGGISLIGCRCGRNVRLAGDMMPIPETPLTVEECREIAASRLPEVYGAQFQKDYPLTLIDTVNGTNYTIRFTADGCDPGKKIAYEILEEYYTDVTGDPEMLTYDELQHIVDFRFGGYRIFISTLEGSNSLNGNIDYFISLDE
jgi:hypothetical protein